MEYRVTEIVTAAKRRRSAYDGEDVAPEKIAKVEETKGPKIEPAASAPVIEKSKMPKPKAHGNETTESSNVAPSKEKESLISKDSEVDSTEADAEGTGLSASIFLRPNSTVSM